jgi:hypothetical protein
MFPQINGKYCHPQTEPVECFVSPLGFARNQQQQQQTHGKHTMNDPNHHFFAAREFLPGLLASRYSLFRDTVFAIGVENTNSGGKRCLTFMATPPPLPTT